MNRALLLLMILALMIPGCEPRQDPAKIRKSIEEQEAKFVEAFNKKDVDGFVACYWNSPELLVMYPDTTLRGYDAFKASTQKNFETVDVKKFEITEQHIEVISHAAIEWGFWKYTFQPKGGPELALAGRYLGLWQEKNGKWVITADHVSVPLQQPPAQASETKDKGK